MALIITFSLLSLSLAGELSPGPYLYNATSNDKFEGFIEAGNASTVREIMLPNIHTNEYPSEGDETEWKAWLQIVEERAQGGLVTAGLHPDEEYISDNGTIQSDDSWLTCMTLTRFRNPDLPLDESIQSDCSNVFEDECLQFLDQMSDDGRFCLDSSIDDELWEDSPCGSALNGDYSRGVLEPQPAFRITDLRNLTLGSSAVNEDGTAPGERYDAFTNSVYMLAVGFARANYDDLPPPRYTIDRDAPTVPSKFICMRADNFSEGSRTLEEIEQNIGICMSAPFGWTMILGASLVMMIAGVL